MRYVGDHNYGSRFTDLFVEVFGLPRRDESPLEKKYADLRFFAVQYRLEKKLLFQWLIGYLKKQDQIIFVWQGE